MELSLLIPISLITHFNSLNLKNIYKSLFYNIKSFIQVGILKNTFERLSLYFLKLVESDHYQNGVNKFLSKSNEVNKNYLNSIFSPFFI